VTQAEANRLVMGLLAAYPTQAAKMDAGTARTMARMYSHALADLEFTAAAKAVQRLIQTSHWMPTVAAIRAEVGEVAHGARRAGGAAWGDVRRAIGKYGHNRVPGQDFQFEDPIVAEAVRGMGWRELCLSENEVADRARFTELYDELARGERKVAAVSYGAVSAKLPAGQPAPLADAVQNVLRALPGGKP
jgi:hypothetical protein